MKLVTAPFRLIKNIFRFVIDLTKGCAMISGIACVPLVILIPLALVLTPLVLMAFWTDRTMDFWLSELLQKTIDIPWFISFVITLVLGGAILITNIASELARLFM